MSIGIRPENAAEQSQNAPPARKMLFRFSIPIPVLGTLILAIALIPVLLRFYRSGGERTHLREIADVHLPEKKYTAFAQDAKREELKKETIIVHSKINAPKAPAGKLSFAAKEETSPASTLPAVVESGDVASQIKEESPAAAELNKRLPEPQTGEKLKSRALSVADLPAEAAPPINIFEAKGKAADGLMDKKEFDANSSTPASVWRARSVQAAPGALPWANSFSSPSLKIGDKIFFLNAGTWIDKECMERRTDSQNNTVLPGATERESIFKQYPELQKHLPAMIYWDHKSYLLQAGN
jgi:hypothetical protein